VRVTAHFTDQPEWRRIQRAQELPGRQRWSQSVWECDRGSDGWLYGVTAFGGGSDRGIVFRIRRGGGDFSVLRRFTGSEDGRNPYGRLAEGADGNLYGTTSIGGRSNSGTVFRVGRNGSGYQLLYGFDGTAAEGVNALGGVSFGPDGLLYGITATGGEWGQGTLFRLNADGSGFEVHHHFRGGVRRWGPSERRTGLW
jgi:uncharacterized repeat protein (TIGR03803 family)